jgi:hypothetical protein
MYVGAAGTTEGGKDLMRVGYGFSPPPKPMDWVMSIPERNEGGFKEKGNQDRARLNATLNDPAVAGVTTSSLTLADNLHHLTAAQTQVPRDGIRDLHTRQLRLLQTVTLQQLGFLLRAEQDVLGHQFMAGDIDEEVLFLEGLANAAGVAVDHAQGSGR